MEGALFAGLLLVIVLLPVPLGSNRAWAWGAMEAASLLLLALWILGHRGAMPRGARSARLPLLLLCLWLAYTVIQVLPLPASLVEIVAPASFQLHRYAALPLAPVFLSLSIDPGATVVEFLKGAMYLALFFLVLVLVDRRARLRTLAWTLLVVGAAEALFGLFAHFSALDILSWDPQVNDVEGVRVRGTFVNRNHFAAHLVMTLAIGLGLLLAGMHAPRSGFAWRQRLERAIRYLLSSSAVVLTLVAISLGALFMSVSRAATLSFSLAVSLVLIVALSAKGLRAPDTRLAPAILAAVIVAISWLGAGGLGERLLDQSVFEDERFEQWTQSARMVTDYPVFGSGGGNYVNLFPLYRSDGLRPLLYDHVHNDYLETLVEYGVLGFLLLGGAVVACLWKLLGAYRRRHDFFMRGMLFGALAGGTALLIHGFLDFNFHIPANAAYFWVLMGIGVVAATLPHREPLDPGSTG